MVILIKISLNNEFEIWGIQFYGGLGTFEMEEKGMRNRYFGGVGF